MTPLEYQSALTALSLTPDQAAIWLGIGRSTAYRYLKTGCEGAVAVAIRQRLAIEGAQRFDMDHEPRDGWAGMMPDPSGEYVRHSDLTAAVGLPG